jgi:hypothetical protein
MSTVLKALKHLSIEHGSPRLGLQIGLGYFKDIRSMSMRTGHVCSSRRWAHGSLNALKKLRLSTENAHETRFSEDLEDKLSQQTGARFSQEQRIIFDVHQILSVAPNLEVIELPEPQYGASANFQQAQLSPMMHSPFVKEYIESDTATRYGSIVIPETRPDFLSRFPNLTRATFVFQFDFGSRTSPRPCNFDFNLPVLQELTYAIPGFTTLLAAVRISSFFASEKNHLIPAVKSLRFIIDRPEQGDTARILNAAIGALSRGFLPRVTNLVCIEVRPPRGRVGENPEEERARWDEWAADEIRHLQNVRDGLKVEILRVADKEDIA